MKQICNHKIEVQKLNGIVSITFVGLPDKFSKKSLLIFKLSLIFSESDWQFTAIAHLPQSLFSVFQLFQIDINLSFNSVILHMKNTIFNH